MTPEGRFEWNLVNLPGFRERIERRLEAIDTPGKPDDLDEIERLLLGERDDPGVV